MAFFDELKKGLSVTGQTVAQKTKEISETVQLKAQLNSEKDAIAKAYAAIGKQVFEAAEADEAEKSALHPRVSSAAEQVQSHGGR